MLSIGRQIKNRVAIAVATRHDTLHSRLHPACTIHWQLVCTVCTPPCHRTSRKHSVEHPHFFGAPAPSARRFYIPVIYIPTYANNHPQNEHAVSTAIITVLKIIAQLIGCSSYLVYINPSEAKPAFNTHKNADFKVIARSCAP